jgi:AraC family transcriptional activator FtrA
MPKNHKIVAVAFDQVAFFELAIAVEIFGLPRPGFDAWYEFTVCAAEPGLLGSYSGLKLDVPKKSLRSLSTAGTIIVPSWRDVNEIPPEPLLKALRRASKRGARILSFCSGAFVLAAAGLLDGREATTHWRFADQLAQMYPRINVNPNVLYLDAGNVLTAAGSAAGIDLCLHLVRSDFGSETANVVARRLVVQPHREGGQAQFIARPLASCDEDGLAALIDWLVSNLEKEHTVKSMATKAKMSPRTFARHFRDQTGTTPARWLSRERVKQAQHLLETTDMGMDQLAVACGLGSAQLLRFHFQRVVGSSPSHYRKAFRRAG